MKKQTIFILFISLLLLFFMTYLFFNKLPSKNPQSNTNNERMASTSDQKFLGNFRKRMFPTDKFNLEISENWTENFYEVPEEISMEPNRIGIREWQFSSDEKKYEIGPDASFIISFFRLIEYQSLEDLVKNDDEIKLIESRPDSLVQAPTRLIVDGYDAIQFTVDNSGGVGEGGFYKEIYIEKRDSVVEIEMIGYDRETFERYGPIFDRTLHSLNFTEI